MLALVRAACKPAARSRWRRSDLDAMAYGQPAAYPTARSPIPAARSAPARAASPRTDVCGNADRKQPGASRQRLRRSPRRATHDAPYHLDAGDKLRVVVDGQEGLTNTYVIDAGGSITMPLIGAVRRARQDTAGLAADIRPGFEPLYTPAFGRRRACTRPSLLPSRKSPPPASILMLRNMSVEMRLRSPAAFRPAPSVTHIPDP